MDTNQFKIITKEEKNEYIFLKSVTTILGLST